MRLGQHSVGPVGIDRTTFDLDLDADVSSRFTGLYRGAYGEPPSHTLRK